MGALRWGDDGVDGYRRDDRSGGCGERQIGCRHLPDFAPAHFERYRALRSSSVFTDGMPYVGRFSGFANLCAATDMR
jgi:hypothetical protein